MSQPQTIDPRFVSRTPVRPPKKRRNWFGRIIGLIVLLFLLVLISVPLYAWGKIDKVDAIAVARARPRPPARRTCWSARTVAKA